MLKRPRAAEAKGLDPESPNKKSKEGRIDGQQPTRTPASTRSPMSPPAAQGHQASTSTSPRPSPLPLKQSEPSKSKSTPQLEPSRLSSKAVVEGVRTTLSNPGTRTPTTRVGGGKPEQENAASAESGEITTTLSMTNGENLGPASAADTDDTKSRSPSIATGRWLSMLAVAVLLLSNLLLYCVWFDTALELEAASYERDQALRHVQVLKDTIKQVSEDAAAQRELLDRHHDAFDGAMADMQAKLLEQEEIMEEVQATCYDALEEAFGEYDDDEREADRRDYDDDESRDDSTFQRDALREVEI